MGVKKRRKYLLYRLYGHGRSSATNEDARKTGITIETIYTDIGVSLLCTGCNLYNNTHTANRKRERERKPQKMKSFQHFRTSTRSFSHRSFFLSVRLRSFFHSPQNKTLRYQRNAFFSFTVDFFSFFPSH